MYVCMYVYICIYVYFMFVGCNQACLDHIFVSKKASCLVNPVAAHETSLVIAPVSKEKVQRIAVVCHYYCSATITAPPMYHHPYY